MREFRWYIETEPGFVRRKLPAEAVTAESMAALDRTMVGHFGRLWARPELAALRAQEFGTVVSVGGGHPNLEGGLRAKAIVVCDPLWRQYEAAADAWRQAWPGAAPATWRPAKGWQGIAAELVVFCHVLEHMTLKESTAALRSVAPGCGILIYGPNADTMHADSWLHALPVHEHLWLGGLEWTRSWAEGTTGRTARVAIAHDLDLLVWLPPAGGGNAGGEGLPPAPPGSRGKGTDGTRGANGTYAANAGRGDAAANPAGAGESGASAAPGIHGGSAGDTARCLSAPPRSPKASAGRAEA
jgi:hypothetical protein